jgi:hypothetical protein
MDGHGQGKRVAILVAGGVRQDELLEANQPLKDGSTRTYFASPSRGTSRRSWTARRAVTWDELCAEYAACDDDRADEGAVDPESASSREHAMRLVRALLSDPTMPLQTIAELAEPTSAADGLGRTRGGTLSVLEVIEMDEANLMAPWDAYEGFEQPVTRRHVRANHGAPASRRRAAGQGL